jgi:hypothetical protein
MYECMVERINIIDVWTERKNKEMHVIIIKTNDEINHVNSFCALLGKKK